MCAHTHVLFLCHPSDPHLYGACNCSFHGHVALEAMWPTATGTQQAGFRREPAYRSTATDYSWKNRLCQLDTDLNWTEL